MAEAPAPSAPAVADAPGQTLVRFVLIAGLGQVLCLCVALSGVTSQLLASEHHVSLPATQSVLNYLALAITFVPALWWQGGLSAALSAGWWRYLLLALADLQANYLMVLAYRYTSMASVQILDCFAIPCTMFLSHLFLHARYRPSHLCGAVLSTVGVLVLVASDGSTPDTHPTQWLGDCLCLLGAALYAVSNVGQELLVKQHTVVEFLAMIGLFGSMLAMLQALVLEGSEVLHVDWSWDIVYLLCGYSLCLYVFYVGVPLLLRLASASLLNVTLLCADAYSLLLASILFAHEFGPAYVISFAAIVLGILLYSCQPVDYQLPAIAHTMAPDSPWAVYHEGGLSLASWRGKPKVMVIGGAGHVGMHLVGMLRDRQVNVTAIDQVSFLPTKGDKLRRQRIAHLKASYDVDVINAPYCNPGFLAKQIEKDTPTHIVYFAYTEKVWFSLAEQTSSLVQCMQEVLDVASIDTDTRLLMVTTVGLGITSEADSVHNSVATLAEGLAWGYHRERKTKVSTVRIGGEVIGPWEHTDMVLTAWAEAAAQKAQVITEVQSTGMLYVKDVAHDLMAILPQAGDSDRWAINDALYPYATAWREIHSAYSLDWSFQNPNLRNAHHHEDSNSIIIPRRTLPSINRTPARDAVGSFLAWYRAYAKDEFVETEVTLEDLYQETIREAGRTKLDMQVDERDRWLDWAMMAKVKLPTTVGEHKYKFFSGKYSLGPPNLLLGRVAKAVGLEILKNTCDSQPRCVGFNTDGMLLTGVLPVAKWEDFPADKKKNASEDDGLFVAEDLNLCEYGDTYYCHLNSHCEMIEPAQYRCVCDEGYTQSTSGTCDMVLPDGVVVPQEEKKEEGKDEGKGEGDVDPAKRREEEEEKESNYLAKVGEVGESKLGGEAGDWVHVVVCSDQEHSVGLATLISSILENTLHPERVQVHVVSSSTKAVAVSRELRCHGLDATGPDYSGPQHQVVVVPFDEDSVKGMYRVHTSTAVTGNLGSALNFARFYLASLLPAVSRAVYLDVDTVVKGDIVDLDHTASQGFDKNPNLVLYVAPRVPNQPMTKQVHEVYVQRHGSDFVEKNMVQYNAGVFVVDLARWQQFKLTAEAEFWMKETLKQKLWDYGTQPIMWLCGLGRTGTVDPRWNVNGLGWAVMPKEVLANAYVLHWSGKSKPWHEDNRYRRHWLEYVPPDSCAAARTKAKWDAEKKEKLAKEKAEKEAKKDNNV